MKNTKILKPGFSEIYEPETARLNGGGFAYDVGRTLRFFGIYLGNGTGIPGTVAAVADLAASEASNSIP